MKNVKNLILFLFVMYLSLGCNSEFLDKKPQKSLLVPTSLKDMQALLDNSRDLMNVSPYLNVVVDGEFRLEDSGLNSVARVVQNAYVWSSEPPATQADWDLPYKQVFYCNAVLDGLSRLTDQAATGEYNRIRGDALFFRGLAFFNLVQLFSVPYQASSAQSALGIPLPLSSDVNLKMPRASLQASYDQVLKDLLEAADLVEKTPLYLTRPSQVAVHALLARVYLMMAEYGRAEQYSDAGLALKNTLLDYNTISTQSSVSFPLPLSTVNPEVLFYIRANNTYLGNTSVFADSTIFNAYAANDLRKKLYFTSALKYKGSYTGTNNPFEGLSTDELYLIKAECLARRAQTAQAMEMIDLLLEKRWIKGSYQPFGPVSQQQALDIIIAERRKELVARGLWWQDLRRLGGDSRFVSTLKRVSSSNAYELLPGDKRYVFKIPLDELAGNPMEQNP